MALLCRGSYLVKKMREYISLSLVRIDVDVFIIQTPRVLAHPYVSCLTVLINTATYYGVGGSQNLIIAKNKEQKVFSYLSLSPVELIFAICYQSCISVKTKVKSSLFHQELLKSNPVWRNKPMLL